MSILLSCLSFVLVVLGVDSLELSCNGSEYLDPSFMVCQMCPVNVFMVASFDGFSCACEENSIPAGIARCRQCNTTEVVSADGTACVPRKCQVSSGRFICRKCPNDYISVTQNLDGSPTKEVLCVKCARGYKVQNNKCVKCAGCTCSKMEVPVRGVCVLKRFLIERPKFEGRLQSTVILDLLKYEYLCTKGDLLACRSLAAVCVKDFYSSEVAGPCRLWIQPKIAATKGLPDLVIAPTANEINPGEFMLPHGKDTLNLVLTVYTNDGGLKILKSPKEKEYQCLLPIDINIGSDVSYDCELAVTKLLSLDQNSTYSAHLDLGGTLRPLPIAMRKPGDYYVRRGTWSSSNFRRFFLINSYIASDTNVTSTVYLRRLLVKINVERDKQKTSSLRVQVRVEAQYENKASLSPTVTTTLRVAHDMPSAGILRGLEIWGGVLGALLALYAAARWRGEMRRGGLHFSLLPLLAGCISDALYFAAWFSTLHALAAEAGTLGLTLPPSRAEEHAVKAFVYAAAVLKGVKIIWLNWRQCCCDMFFLDWNEYNPLFKDATLDSNHVDWRPTTLAREWSRVQTLRRAPPSYTAVLSLLILHLMRPWLSPIHQSQGYRWAVAGVAWWGSYVTVLVVRWVLDRMMLPPPAVIPSVCRGVGLSLLVFQEEHYGHYVHGRSEDNKELRMMTGPLAMCRIAMAPQLRIVYNQLSSSSLDDSDALVKQALLSKLLAAFFERALDGLSWVASERTVLERLLDVEITKREAGTTSVLLYDQADSTPSCVAVTWWGEEWSLGTFDAMLFGLVVLVTAEPLLAALIAVLMWQIMRHLRHFFGNRNQTHKTNTRIN